VSDFFVVWLGHPQLKRWPPVASTSPSKQLPAQVAFAKKAADAKAAKAMNGAIAPELIEANEQELAEAVLTDSNRLAREHYERRVHAARGPPAQLGVQLLSKREILAITNVTFPTIWAWMRAGTFPRSRVVGGKSMWLSTDIEGWLAALPVRKLKGDAS
jgi:predicted DNA-binding transcriptional regulator AlpA